MSANDYHARKVAISRGRKPCDPNPPARGGGLSCLARVRKLLAPEVAAHLAAQTIKLLSGWAERLTGDPLHGLTDEQRRTLYVIEKRAAERVGAAEEAARLPTWLTAPEHVSAAERGLPTAPPGVRR